MFPIINMLNTGEEKNVYTVYVPIGCSVLQMSLKDPSPVQVRFHIRPFLVPEHDKKTLKLA